MTTYRAIYLICYAFLKLVQAYSYAWFGNIIAIEVRKARARVASRSSKFEKKWYTYIVLSHSVRGLIFRARRASTRSTTRTGRDLAICGSWTMSWSCSRKILCCSRRRDAWLWGWICFRKYALVFFVYILGRRRRFILYACRCFLPFFADRTCFVVVLFSATDSRRKSRGQA